MQETSSGDEKEEDAGRKKREEIKQLYHRCKQEKMGKAELE